MAAGQSSQKAFKLGRSDFAGVVFKHAFNTAGRISCAWPQAESQAVKVANIGDDSRAGVTPADCLNHRPRLQFPLTLPSRGKNYAP